MRRLLGSNETPAYTNPSARATLLEASGRGLGSAAMLEDVPARPSLRQLVLRVCASSAWRA